MCSRGRKYGPTITGSCIEFCDDGVSRDLRVAGKVRLHELNTTNPIAAGDEVNVSTRENGGEKMIEDISPRQNYIIRRAQRGARHILAAN